MRRCGFYAQGRTCELDEDHACYDRIHRDASGFEFIDERFPNRLGNGPSGYPMNNPAFDQAVAKVVESRKEDAKKAEAFLRKLRYELEKASNGNG